MKHAANTLAAFALLVLATAGTPARAQWNPNGTPLCVAAGDQTGCQIVSDETGGAIIAWLDERNGATDIYAQRVDVRGIPQWTANGVPVCTAQGVRDNLVIAPDGSGGAILVWRDGRNSRIDLYAQRINAQGTAPWTANGVAVCTAPDSQWSPQVVSDGAGGAVVAWCDHRNGGSDVFAQRLSAYGTVRWLGSGVAVCTAPGEQTFPKLVHDGAGGAVITWYDLRGGRAQIYAQRVDASGIPLWELNGVLLCAALEGERYWPQITTSDGSGALVIWNDSRSGCDDDIYAQRVNGNGILLYPPNGVPVCGLEAPVQSANGSLEDTGGAIVTWLDRRNVRGIYAQALNREGKVLWSAGGVPICTASVIRDAPRITVDDGHGAIIAWDNGRTGSCEIYAQRVDAAGAVHWRTDGAALCNASGDQLNPVVVPDGAGGAIAAWEDRRGGSGADVYVQCVSANGRGGLIGPEIAAVRDVPGDQGGWVTMDIARSRFDSPTETVYPITAYDVWFRTSRRGTPPGPAFPYGTWEIVTTIPASYQDHYACTLQTYEDSLALYVPYSAYVVVARTTDPGTSFPSYADSGYSMDNIPPAPPTGLAAQPSATPLGLYISWNANTEGEFSYYAVYRGLSEDFAPKPTNRLATTTARHYFDPFWRALSGYRYKVSACDIHDTESAATLLDFDPSTDAGAAEAPLVTFLAQNNPNPFNPMTRIRFGLAAAGRVSIRIYDVSGRLIRALVDEERSAGRYEARWDGRDSRGRPVASGIYFCRMTAGDFKETRKLALLR